MRIQHNIPAMSAYRNYTRNVSAVSKNLEKLSSGYRINRAGDDAAGLAISEKMRIQITGLEQAQSNAKSGINLVQTAEGAMTEIHDMLNRMYTLAEQSANGTYSDDVDREQLQKEVVSLRTEINRIADATNYNGINLLDGSQAKPEGVTIGQFQADTQAAKTSGALGTFGTQVDGKLTAGAEPVKYEAKFYVGNITNNNAGNKTFKLTYKDASGADKQITLTVDAKKEATTADIVAAIKNIGTKSGNVTAADAGTAAAQDTAGDNCVKDGKFNELYDISADGNIITIKAKYSGGEAADSKGDGTGTAWGKVADADADSFEVSFANVDMETGDVDAAQKALEEKYDGATTNKITFFGAAGEPTANVNKGDKTYQVASAKLTLAGTDAAAMHNQAIQVGDKVYVIKDKDKALDDATPAGAITVELDGSTAKNDVAKALAAKITAQETTNGRYVAKDNGDGSITVSESTEYGRQVLLGTDGYEPGKAAEIFKNVDMTFEAAASGQKGEITFDATKLKNGTLLTVGEKTYVLSSDPNQEITTKQDRITFDKDATSQEVAEAVKTKLAADGVTGVTTDGAKVKFAVSNVTGQPSAIGRGLELQIGDTADSFNKMNVSIKNMHANAMTFTTADVGENATDLQKAVAAKGLSIANIDISTQEGASDAMAVIKNATNYVSDVRGDLGALQNRLDHTINNLSVTQENIQDAESTIRDVDIAKEMMAYTKNNILVQSAQAMLAQANQLPQGVLQLLG